MAYNYHSPIELIANQVDEKIENDCVFICRNYGFNVDKEELKKALEYDRNQYDEGFRDGYQQARNQGEWLPNYTSQFINSGRKCSLCGKVVEFSENYCPNCGAIMK